MGKYPCILRGCAATLCPSRIKCVKDLKSIDEGYRICRPAPRNPAAGTISAGRSCHRRARITASVTLVSCCSLAGCHDPSPKRQGGGKQGALPNPEDGADVTAFSNGFCSEEREHRKKHDNPSRPSGLASTCRRWGRS